MTLFDANAWLGAWPFAFLPERDPTALVAHLRVHRVRRALVSPLAAVFAPEPGPANRALLATTARERSLVPLPVINPALANWRHELATVAADSRVRAVRWLPAYHNYRLDGRSVDGCAEELRRRGLRLVLTARLVDERHEYFALRIKGVTPAAIDRFLTRHARLPVLVTGCSRPDILQLAPRHRQLLADLSFAEWERTVEHVLETVSARQLVFGSHTPFLITAASVAKLTGAAVRRSQLEQIAHGNLERFLAP